MSWHWEAGERYVEREPVQLRLELLKSSSEEGREHLWNIFWALCSGFLIATWPMLWIHCFSWGHWDSSLHKFQGEWRPCSPQQGILPCSVSAFASAMHYLGWACDASLLSAPQASKSEREPASLEFVSSYCRRWIIKSIKAYLESSLDFRSLLVEDCFGTSFLWQLKPH